MIQTAVHHSLQAILSEIIDRSNPVQTKGIIRINIQTFYFISIINQIERSNKIQKN